MIVMKAEGRAIEENEGVRMSLGFPDGTAVKEKKKKTPTCLCRRQERPGFDPWVRKLLGEGTATRSRALAWELPWTERPGGSMGSQRVGLD